MAIKKGWKITWIALGSLVGLIVVVIGVVLWLVFTPSRLTGIVNSLAGRFITCDARFGKVDLTLLSTFPDAGLRIEDVVIVNPMEGWDSPECTPSDTLAYVGSLTVGIDLKAFLRENKVIVHQVLLDDAQANLYIAQDGTSNFDIFPKGEERQEEDTSSASMPELIDLQKIKINNLNAYFNDRRDGMEAGVKGLDVSVKGEWRVENGEWKTENGGNIDFALEGEKIDLSMQGVGEALTHLMAENLELDIDGALADDKVDAKVTLGGKTLMVNMYDSVGNPSLETALDALELTLKGGGTMDEARCALSLGVEKGTLNAGGTEMVNATLRESKKDLLGVECPDLVVKLNKKEVWISDAKLKLDNYALLLNGQCFLPHDSDPLRMDMAVATDGKWRVAPLLDIVPQQYVSFRKGMEMDGDVSFELAAMGAVTDSTMPAIGGSLTLGDGRYYAPKILPYKINKIKGDVEVDLCLDQRKESHVNVKNLKMHTRGTDLAVNGKVDDLLGDMRVDARVKGTLPLEDAMPMIPKEMNVKAKGDAALDVQANFRMSQLSKGAYDKMKASATVKLKELDAQYDDIHATSPQLDVTVQLPAKNNKGMLADAQVKGTGLRVSMGKTLKANLDEPDISLGVNNVIKDSMLASFGELKLKGSMRMDTTQKNILKQFNPQFDASTHSMVFYAPQLPEAMRLTELDVKYRPNHCDIRRVLVQLGHSDFSLYGTLDNLEEWLSDNATLQGDLNFTSSYADVDQMMNLFSGMGSDADSLAAMREEDHVPADANPFIVPKNVDVTLNTHIQRSVAFGNDLNDVAGSLTVRNGVAVLDQVGFVCKAATMQLTALYRSPRPSNLFASLDFHLLDIRIDELIDMIPTVDSLVPLLAAFEGNANFHLAGETYLDARYHPKVRTIKGAAAISGQNLVVMDNSNIARIAKLMKAKKWKEKDNKIHVDSLSVEMTCRDVGFGPEVEVFPFLLSIGSYQVCASGVQNLDNSCNYHVELLKNPLLAKVGVDVKGTLASPKISLGKVLYDDMYKPKRQGVTEKKALELKDRIRKALEKNVR